MTRRLGLLLLVVLCSVSGYYLLVQHGWQQVQQVTPDAEKPLFTGEAIQTVQYDADGVRSYTVHAKHLEHYAKIDETHFNEPVLWTYKAGTEEEWRVSADYAILSDDHLLTMTGNVRIFNLLPNAQIDSVATDSVTLNLTTRDFWSESPTTITGTRFQTKGKRVKGNFGNHQMELLDDVRGRYETTPR
ncbi:LPS export ABC transporter periplasmic protein LptC [Salinivibrio sp. IB282]|uniref:LPS export ABC transporter periplasmic protein LptC n=1 Tax=Salinivibrio sp. IB282 TaxID=1766122 RepID=UPI0009883D63|nr:LPS export ABC transporter periplasmic protein LptC [Salinivibrio sp. IB282]OOE61132.1 LPS export ABC transporter periplasmic protein LptC [Salinivibrio sp. IB282]